MSESLDKSNSLIFSPKIVDPGSQRSLVEKPLVFSQSKTKLI